MGGVFPMAVKLFIIGLPGSGKSAVARKIGDYVRNKSWTTRRFNDYRILNAMFRFDKQGWFKPAPIRGFNVIDITAFDFALNRLERAVARYLSSVHVRPEEIVFIEFARNDYWRAFKQFDPSFLKDAYFIHLQTKVEVCQERVKDRVQEPEYPADDYPVSDYIFEKYYHSDDGRNLLTYFRDVFGIDEKRLLKLKNNFSLEEAMLQIEPFIDGVIKIESGCLSAMQEQEDHPKMSSPMNKPGVVSDSTECSEPDLKTEEEVLVSS